MASVCKCGLNFEELNTAVSVQTLADMSAVSIDGIYVHCPACGTRNLIDLRPYGFFQWKGAFYRWRQAPTKIELTARGGYRVRLGALALDFPESLIAHDKFSVEQICYPAVPVFAELDGAASVPLLPVRREYLDLVDAEQSLSPERRLRPERTAKGEYRFRFHLRVLGEVVEVVRPAVPVTPDRPSAAGGDVFVGAHLALWPQTDYREWRRYFLRFGAGHESPVRKASAYARAAPALDRPADEREWIKLATESADGRTLYGCVESRPDWVAIEFENDHQQDKLAGGGLWHVEPAASAYPQGSVRELGLDFGTSNTCFAWTPVSDEPELLPIESREHFIIQGSELPEALDSVDTWLPRQGFGRSSALLPTEILTRQPLDVLRSRASEIKGWRPVVDYSIPTGGVEVRYTDEEQHILADFKWENMIVDAAFEPHFKELQKRYLELALLCALAQLAARRAIASEVHVHFSYPLAFDQNVLDDYKGVMDEVAEAVSRQAGVKVGREENPLDEARAAARHADQPGAQDSACLYVDIGGGSTDIALLRRSQGGKELDTYTYICSFQYAGSALTTALAKGGCLAPGSDLARFRRKLREVGSVKELMNSESVFLSKKRNAIEAKSSYFYAYLRQFLARLLAAHIITGEWRGQADGPAAQAAAGGQQQRPVYHVLLYPLGNGWGFGSFIDAQYTRRFTERLTGEANNIIRDAVDRGIVPPDTPEVLVKDSEPKHPKSAVAFGVLSEVQGRQTSKQEWPSRTILGWTTQVGRTHKVDWYQPIVGDSADPPRGQPEVPPHATLDCPPGEWPAFPDSLYTPHDLDDGLKRTGRYLARCSPGAGEKKWFVESPFHVMLEKLFKPELEKLT